MKKQPAKADTATLSGGIGLSTLDDGLSEDRPEDPCYWACGTCGNVFVVLRGLGWQSALVANLRKKAAVTLLSDAPLIPRLDLPLGIFNAVVSVMPSKLLSLGTLLTA